MTKLGRSWPAFILLVAALVLAGLGARSLFDSARQPATTPGSSLPDDWPTYMHDPARSGFNPGEVRLSPANASKLRLAWKQDLGDVLAAQPIVKGDTVYIGSWSGALYALSTVDGSIKWQTNLGTTTSDRCVPKTAGITSAADVTGDALYIGGGDQYLYALDPKTGNALWKFQTGDNSPDGGSYNWASPLVYNGKVYYATAAFCDDPYALAHLFAINEATGKPEQQVRFLPGDERGGGLWTSPTVDEATGDLYVTIASGDYYVPYNYTLARLDRKTMQVADGWQVPIDNQIFDGDWGTTPTLFRDRQGKLMVGASAKNGIYYAFHAHNIAPGPAWSLRISDGGSCPQCGEGAISTSVYAYDTIYVAAGYLSLGQAQKFPGTVHALDPSTGAVKWIHPTSGGVMPALAAANGLLAVGADDTVEVLDAATGDLLWEYATEATLYSPPTIAGGMLYVASTDGYIYAFTAGPYPDNIRPYGVSGVGSNPPNFTPFRTPVEAAKLPGPEQCFTDTNKCARGDLLAFWQANGGLERFGPAETNELNEAGRIVQYFRNAVLELHPKQDGTGVEVRPGKLDFRLAYFDPKNDNFEPAKPISASTYVQETQHSLGEPFLSYWQEHGQVAGLGYPVSEPFNEYNALDGQTRLVQYFEQARLEIVKAPDGSESVAVGALGLVKYKQRYGKLP